MRIGDKVESEEQRAEFEKKIGRKFRLGEVLSAEDVEQLRSTGGEMPPLPPKKKTAKKKRARKKKET